MLATFFTFGFALLSVTQATHKVELSDEKTPYDYVKERLDAIGSDPKTGLPLTNLYEVEESEDYADHQGAASSILNTVTAGSGLGYGQSLGLGAFGNLGGIGLGQGIGQGIGQGLGLGVGGIGGIGIGGIGGPGIGLGAVSGTGIGAGGIGITNGVGLINPGVNGIGVGGIGLGNGLLYQPILNTQVASGYVDKHAYDAAEKKGADENLEKVEKKLEEETKHGQEGFQQAAAAAKEAKHDSTFYKDEEANKKATGDEKFYEGGQKVNKHGANEEQLKKAKSHKKGHVSKGFKTSSSKNEEEKSESYYDEAHDEADHKIAGQNAGSFGEETQHGFKGAHEEKLLDANAQGKEGHHVTEQKIDDTKANKGEFLQKGYKGGAEQLEKFNNLGAHAVHGHQEATAGFQQNKGILPING